MIITYSINENGDVKRNEVSASTLSLDKVVWIDLFEPTIEEEKAIENLLGIDAPTREEMDKIEVANPFYRSGDADYMTITVVSNTDFDYPQSEALTFILTTKCLVTISYSRPKGFYNANLFIKKVPWSSSSPDAIMESIIEMISSSIADTLEKTGNKLDSLLKEIFNNPNISTTKNLSNENKYKKKSSNKGNDNTSSNYYKSIIKRIGLSGNLISKSRESLMSINRMIIFFSQMEDARYVNKKEHRARLRHITREVHSLSQYVDFLSQRNAFLLDATLGMISVEQNMIIKFFTVAATVFLPPTLIASIYGMNFKFMPETDWEFGYPLIIFFIILSGIIPLIYCKHKNLL